MNTFKIILVLALGVLGSGCADTLAKSSESVLAKYKDVVTTDGVNVEEAKVIAQHELIRANEVRIYDLEHPQVEDTPVRVAHAADYWFIYFNERDTADIPYIFMVAVHKLTGHVQFANDYAAGRHWVLEAGMLKNQGRPSATP